MNRRQRQRRLWLSRALAVASGSLLLRTAGAGATPSDATPSDAASSPARYVTSARFADDDYRLVLLDKAGKVLHRQALPGRAHGAAVHARRGTGCVFARRPGQWLCAVDVRHPDTLRTVAPAAGRRFSGHGVHSHSGSRLYTTENDIDRQRGVVGVYDVESGYRRVGEFASGGVGPHEIVRVPGSDLLVVANGGIATHPDVGEGREPLNLNDMAPSISVMDARDGRRLSRHTLPDDRHRISLRHLAIDAQQRVWYAGQYGRRREDTEPLDEQDTAALAGSLSLRNGARRGSKGALEPLLLPADLLSARQGYLSSVASAGSDVLYTAARDGVAFLIDPLDRRLIDSLPCGDCSGVAPDARGGYLVSNGGGELAVLTSRTERLEREPLTLSAFDWDNHISAVAS